MGLSVKNTDIGLGAVGEKHRQLSGAQFVYFNPLVISSGRTHSSNSAAVSNPS